MWVALEDGARFEPSLEDETLPNRLLSFEVVGLLEQQREALYIWIDIELSNM